MLDFINDFLYYFGLLTFLIPVIIFLFKRRRILSPLGFYILINAFSAGLSYAFLVVFSNSYPVFHLSVFLSSVSLVWYYKNGDFKYSISYLVVILFFAILFISDVFVFKGLWQNNFVTTIFSNVCLTLLSLRHLYILLSESNIRDVFLLEEKFFIAISILIFNSSSFFFSLLENEIRSDENEFFLITFPLFAVFTILHNVLISIGLWKQAKES